MRGNKICIGIVFFSVLSLFSGCSNKPTTTEIKVVFPNHVWNRFAPMDATFEIVDVNKTYEIAVGLSVVNGFEWDNVPIEMVITSPDGQQNIVNRTIAVKKDGNYVGEAFGDVWATKLVVYKEKQFSEAGTYSIYIENRTQYYELYKTESLSFSVRTVKK